ncbi:MAG: signal recognition particle receptor subunit alpha, partial [SAR324 cluster bacterium]|nr:signal recognition particle receptor subunit alpha [SAR324 cluster bacterium]
MFFSKKKKEEKKRLKELSQVSKEKTLEFSDKITKAHENLQAQGSLLTKELKGSEIEGKTGFFAKLIAGLAKTKRLLVGGILELASEDAADADFLEELEERLIVADLGAATVMKIIDMVQKKLDAGALKTQADVVEEVKSIFTNILHQGDHAMPFSEVGPTVHLFVGVNGVGKTTTIGKLAAQYKAEGKKVLVAAGDTFRAAAIEQMAEWCRRSDIDLVKKDIGADPSAVLYEAAERAKKENYDILLCDTSGRLHTKDHLMDELKKMKRAIQKVLPE